MRDQAISETLIEERYTVPADQTARRLFASLPHGRAYASQLVDAMATGYLVTVLESVCARALQPILRQGEETVVGSRVELQHRAPAVPGATLRLWGWVERMGDRDVTFWIGADHGDERICEARVVLHIVSAEAMTARIARKLGRDKAQPCLALAA